MNTTAPVAYHIGRDTTRIGTWVLTWKGKKTYHQRKSEALARAARLALEEQKRIDARMAELTA